MKVVSFLLLAACGGGTPAGIDSAVAGDIGGALDALVDAPPGPLVCGAGFCRLDQTCEQGQCVFACSGTHVPGDYATIQGAVNALDGIGGTICLGAQLYDEQIAFQATASPPNPLTIIGPSREQTTISDIVIPAGSAYDKVTMRGATVGRLAITRATIDASFTGMRFGLDVSMTPLYIRSAGSVDVDGCEIAGPVTSVVAKTALYVGSDGLSPSTVRIANSWIHGVENLVQLNPTTTPTNTEMKFELLNNTLVGTGAAMQTGIFVYADPYHRVALHYWNNLITHTAVGVSITSAGAPVQHSNNLLWANQSNYAGFAVQGPGYVLADPRLDTLAPPGPEPGSPALDATDKARATAIDFWGLPRGLHPTIGAVQR